PIATVTVTDSNGTTATGSAVHAPVPAAEHTCPATALGSVFSPTELEIGALGLAIAATVAAVLLWRRE
ncbi:MAG: hypothetical protein L3J96_07340, partial [Thermoplasmata archaeon]|nr:hypothetical protein [Thermoplasmata archaeon]